ncbi:hypothetical protein GCM10010358_24800 [Streptomyces minutiscleroticus]|uniref:Uncharacterized protein n=1 Tax=Streptomyces minutiscleroticus TaxID=68238 RepID=A0A918NGS2_9ACTN|nr:hypothetical protein GCM10010358_24800 [Streptomyces minutiscleroticus]
MWSDLRRCSERERSYEASEDVNTAFRDDSFPCLLTHGGTLFEPTEALLCADRPVAMPADPRPVAKVDLGRE